LRCGRVAPIAGNRDQSQEGAQKEKDSDFVTALMHDARANPENAENHKTPIAPE
jgi:hypothetical protein